jgi:choline dehydrogenase-like flavoprotein
MGFTPEDSVVDANHRAWEVENLFVVDGSVFPTEGAANPALIIMALADRRASLVKRKQAGPAEARLKAVAAERDS